MKPLKLVRAEVGEQLLLLPEVEAVVVVAGVVVVMRQRTQCQLNNRIFRTLS